MENINTRSKNPARKLDARRKDDKGSARLRNVAGLEEVGYGEANMSERREPRHSKFEGKSNRKFKRNQNRKSPPYTITKGAELIRNLTTESKIHENRPLEKAGQMFQGASMIPTWVKDGTIGSSSKEKTIRNINARARARIKESNSKRGYPSNEKGEKNEFDAVTAVANVSLADILCHVDGVSKGNSNNISGKDTEAGKYENTSASVEKEGQESVSCPAKAAFLVKNNGRAFYPHGTEVNEFSTSCHNSQLISKNDCCIIPTGQSNKDFLIASSGATTSGNILGNRTRRLRTDKEKDSVLASASGKRRGKNKTYTDVVARKCENEAEKDSKVQEIQSNGTVVRKKDLEDSDQNTKGSQRKRLDIEGKESAKKLNSKSHIHGSTLPKEKIAKIGIITIAGKESVKTLESKSPDKSPFKDKKKSPVNNKRLDARDKCTSTDDKTEEKHKNRNHGSGTLLKTNSEASKEKYKTSKEVQSKVSPTGKDKPSACTTRKDHSPRSGETRSKRSPINSNAMVNTDNVGDPEHGVRQKHQSDSREMLKPAITHRLRDEASPTTGQDKKGEEDTLESKNKYGHSGEDPQKGLLVNEEGNNHRSVATKEASLLNRVNTPPNDVRENGEEIQEGKAINHNVTCKETIINTTTEANVNVKDDVTTPWTNGQNIFFIAPCGDDGQGAAQGRYCCCFLDHLRASCTGINERESTFVPASHCGSQNNIRSTSADNVHYTLEAIDKLGIIQATIEESKSILRHLYTDLGASSEVARYRKKRLELEERRKAEAQSKGTLTVNCKDSGKELEVEQDFVSMKGEDKKEELNDECLEKQMDLTSLPDFYPGLPSAKSDDRRRKPKRNRTLLELSSEWSKRNPRTTWDRK